MSPKPIADSTLFYGDNLPIRREHVTAEILAAVNGVFAFTPRMPQLT